MRKTSILICCVAGLLFTAASSTGSPRYLYFYFAKADTSKDAFRNDEMLCERTTSTNNLAPGLERGPYGHQIDIVRHTRGFLYCMTEKKGYRLDPSGYRTTQSWNSRG